MQRPPKKSHSSPTAAGNVNPKGHKLNSKSISATAHKAPGRRNESKVRGR